jgi:hypothetical protein
LQVPKLPTVGGSVSRVLTTEGVGTCEDFFQRMKRTTTVVNIHFFHSVGRRCEEVARQNGENRVNRSMTLVDEEFLSPMGGGEELRKLQDLMEDGKFLASLGRKYDFQVKMPFRLFDILNARKQFRAKQVRHTSKVKSRVPGLKTCVTWLEHNNPFSSSLVCLSDISCLEPSFGH